MRLPKVSSNKFRDLRAQTSLEQTIAIQRETGAFYARFYSIFMSNTNGSLHHFAKYLSLSEKFAHLNFFLADNSLRCGNNAVILSSILRKKMLSNEITDNKCKIILNEKKMYIRNRNTFHSSLQCRNKQNDGNTLWHCSSQFLVNLILFARQW